MDENGWVDVEKLLKACSEINIAFSKEELAEVVATNDKKRFAFDASQTKIRASQGHSVKIKIEFEEKTPPPILFHGTADAKAELILENGLRKMSRHHVHLSSDAETARRVGNRRGKPVIFQVETKAMSEKGCKFYVSANGVWLTDAVPPEFLSIYEAK